MGRVFVLNLPYETREVKARGYRDRNGRGMYTMWVL